MARSSRKSANGTSQKLGTRAYVGVSRADDSEQRYARPDVLEIVRADTALRDLDAIGGLASDQADHIRVLLAAVGRMSAGDMAEAFPPLPHLTVVGTEAAEARR